MQRSPKDKQALDKQALMEDNDSLYDINVMASANDCTGLIPSAPVSEAEAESYTELYAIPTPAEDSPDSVEQKAEPTDEVTRE